jgi:hypothetical protein
VVKKHNYSSIIYLTIFLESGNTYDQNKSTATNASVTQHILENSNYLPQLYSVGNNLSNSLNKKPSEISNITFYTHLTNNNNLNSNYNLQKKDIDYQLAHYLYTHTTESDIKYALINMKQQEKPSNVDKELPRPLGKLQNRDSENDKIANLLESVKPTENAQLVQNFFNNIKSVFNSTSQETNDDNVSLFEKKLTTTASIVFDKTEMSTMSTVQQLLERKLSR